MNIKRIIFSLSLFIVATPFYAHHTTLREKIGQMLIIGFQGKTIDKHSAVTHFIKKDNIGGVILFDYNPQTQAFDKNIESPGQLKKLNSQLQKSTHKANKKHDRPDVPLLISVDYEGGYVNRLHPKYGFPEIPSQREVGEKSLDDADNIAKLMAFTLHNIGINLNYSPDLDVNVNPENPIIGKLDRSFSAVPSEVAQYGEIYSREFLANGIECTYKHFPGHGSSTSDSHLGFADIKHTWNENELFPFLQLLSRPKHCNVIMIAHVVNRRLDATGVPATLSLRIIKGLLRDQLKFDGVVITDDMQMKAISDYYGVSAAVTLSINAGTDMLIFGNQLATPQDPEDLIDIIEQKVLAGDISEKRIDEAYSRIIKMKRNLKIMA